jgi:hypothetical protein
MLCGLYVRLSFVFLILASLNMLQNVINIVKYIIVIRPCIYYICIKILLQFTDSLHVEFVSYSSNLKFSHCHVCDC